MFTIPAAVLLVSIISVTILLHRMQKKAQSRIMRQSLLHVLLSNHDIMNILVEILGHLPLRLFRIYFLVNDREISYAFSVPVYAKKRIRYLP